MTLFPPRKWSPSQQFALQRSPSSDLTEEIRLVALSEESVNCDLTEESV